MGNTSSSGGNTHNRRHPNYSPRGNPYLFAAASPYPNPNNPPLQYYNYPGGPGLHVGPVNWAGGTFPSGPNMVPASPQPAVEYQKAVSIKNDVNIKKESLRVEKDEDNPGKFLVSFTFDATVSGSITIIFFAREGEDCSLIPTKENVLPPVTVHFEQGLGQKFRQPSGTGIDFSVFEEAEFLKVCDMDVSPLAVKAEAASVIQNGSDGSLTSMNSQITQAVFEKEKGEYQVRVVKQILWVNGMRYELQEIYGIGNSIDSELDGNDPGRECVICLTEPRDTTVLPCRHMCMCSGCAKVLRFQTNLCPICRQPVERLLEIKVSSGSDE